MLVSFYSSSANAAAQQEKLNVIGNNMANIGTYGFKKGRTEFTDLYYQNIKDPENVEDTTRKNGSGVRIQQVLTDFTTAGAMQTGEMMDYYIGGSGFFAVQDPNTKAISYTRDGSFFPSQAMDGKFYLTHKASGGRVLDTKGVPIEVKDAADAEKWDVAIYDFPNVEGFTQNGNSTFSVGARSGKAFLVVDAKPEQGMLEASNVELSEEMSRIIVAQRSYSMNLKMLQVSDEIIQEINKFR